MQRIIFLICFTLLFSVSAMALETDNFLMWGRELEEATLDVNSYIENKIQHELNQINRKHEDKDCEIVRDKLIKSFRGFITHPMEHWIEATLGPAKVFPSEEEFSEEDYFAMSIYATHKFDVSKYFSLSRNININGIYIGTDKFSHWMSTGARYYKKYENALKRGKSEEDAFRSAINYGIFLDRFVLGGVSSGVFSFGDLEANFQGLLLNRNFCRVGEQNYLKFDGRNWIMTRKIDVRDYVNPNWDETYNPSVFSALKWIQVQRNFKKENCQKLASQVFHDRFKYYNSIIKPSFSVEYIHELKSQSKRLPKHLNRNYREICIP